MHQCTFYCQYHEHVCRALAPVDMPATDVCATLQRAASDVEILRAVPAREADVPTWEKELACETRLGARHSRHRLVGARGRRTPWLVFYRYKRKRLPVPPPPSAGITE